MKTNLIGWSVDEYKEWLEGHEECRKTNGLRHVTAEEVRLDFDGRDPKIAGYASVFNTFYTLGEGFREQVAPGAFAQSIIEDDIRALLNHDPNFVLGRNRAGTLMLREDERGLYYEILTPDTQFARDLQISIKRKDITQSSFGFNILEQDLKREKGMVSRTLTRARLFDVSPVTYPANPQTEVSMRMTAGRSEGSEIIVVAGELPAPQSNTEFIDSLAEFKTRIGWR